MKTFKGTIPAFLFLVFCLFSTSCLRAQATDITADDAVFTSQKLPEDLDREHVYTFQYTVKNTGTTTWKIDIYQLKISVASSVFTGESVWLIPNINIPNDVSPGSEITISTKVEVWHVNGDYTFTAQMLHNDKPFGTASITVTINVH